MNDKKEVHVHHHYHYYEDDIVKMIRDVQYADRYNEYMVQEQLPYIPEDPESCQMWKAKNEYETQNPRWKFLKGNQESSIITHITEHVGLKKKVNK